MKFDNRYEHYSLGFRDNKLGIIRGIFKTICSQCRTRTYWLHMESEKHICSEECLEKLKGEKL
jgi:hypothetical protein